jgi:heparan-alpha-glucosaminide N-acetyltransferase
MGNEMPPSSTALPTALSSLVGCAPARSLESLCEYPSADVSLRLSRFDSQCRGPAAAASLPIRSGRAVARVGWVDCNLALAFPEGAGYKAPLTETTPKPAMNDLTTKPTTTRLGSIDAFRGLVMFLMMAEVLHLSGVSEALPKSGFWAFLAHHQSHVAWVGCSLHDLIQPSFSFLVGTALAFSMANRLVRGQSIPRMFGHAVWRSFLLIALGIFLRSIGRSQTNYTFEDTLTQIGLGYAFLFLVALRPRKEQWAAFLFILVGYWAAFALYPLPGPDFNWAAAGVSPDSQNNLAGFAAHWNKNTNLAWAFDTWFLNLFPRETPFTHNSGGYATLSFIPTLGTMILGLIAGEWLKSAHPERNKVRRLAIVGLAFLGLAWFLDWMGVCPIVKKIWTPTWVLFSGGWCLLILAMFVVAVDMARFKAWAFPLIVIGMNPIAAYMMDHLFGRFIRSSLDTHLGASFFLVFGAPYESLVRSGLVLLILWLILFWMYRRKLFLKI